ncbi:MFS transporter [Chitinophaga vietnamensis]|uniref:MFS transporter n=1 Tax=Chitinophaga vietnamensis TaxID=2593957 RepID=UPI0011785B4C|nr:MFS transporter [Chitinophaga vietnamensis]
MKKIAYIGCLGMIGVITTEFGIIGVLPQVAEYYRISVDKAGWLLSAFALVIALAGPFMTLLLSGLNRKYLMAFSIFLFLISGMVALFSPPFWLLLIARMLPAFLQPVYISTAIAAATSGADKKATHTMMAIVLGGIGLSTITTIPLATYMAGVFQRWQASFVVQCLVSLIALISILLALPTMLVAEKKQLGSQLKILQKPGFIISTVIVFLMNAAMFTTYSYFADYLKKVNEMDQGTISSMLLLFGAAGVAGNFVAGKALGKSLAGTTAFFLIGLMLTATGIYYFSTMSFVSVLLVAVWGFLHTPCFLTGQAYMISYASEAPEFANSLSISFGNLGISAGTLAGGWVIAQYGVHNTPWAMCVLCAAALSLLLIQRFE